MSDAHEKQFHELQVNQDRPESRKNHEKSSKRGHKPAHLCETRFGKLVFLRKSKITDVSYIGQKQVHDCLFSFSRVFSLAARTPTRVFKNPEKSETRPNPKFPSFPESRPGKP